MFVALSGRQEAALGTVLHKEWFGNGRSIPFKFSVDHCIENLSASAQGPAQSDVWVVCVNINEDVLCSQMAAKKVQWGLSDGRPGMRWLDNFQLNLDIDYKFNPFEPAAPVPALENAAEQQ